MYWRIRLLIMLFLTYTLALQNVNFPEGSTLLACDAVSLGQ